jgi:hypothetical protein
MANINMLRQYYQYHIDHKIEMVEYGNTFIAIICANCNEELFTINLKTELHCPIAKACISAYCSGPILKEGLLYCSDNKDRISKYIKDKEE